MQGRQDRVLGKGLKSWRVESRDPGFRRCPAYAILTNCDQPASRCAPKRLFHWPGGESPLLELSTKDT